MLVASFIDSILVSILQYLPVNGFTIIEKYLVQIFNKVDFLLLIIICNCLFLYTSLITIPKVKQNANKIFKIFNVIQYLFANLFLFSKYNFSNTKENIN